MDTRVAPAHLASTEKTKISVRDLNFYYGGFHALKNINMEVFKQRLFTEFGNGVIVTNPTVPGVRV